MTILILAPHPDDGEFGCGASIKKWADQGDNIHYIAFSPCHKSVPKNFDKDILYKELKNACHHLGIRNENITTFNFPVREFPKYRQEILEELIAIRKKIGTIDKVVLPNSMDVHQDHQVIHQEGIRAFKHSCLLGYELPWNNLTFTSNYHSRLSIEDLDAKWQAISEYQSQGFRNYKSKTFLEGLARVRGTQIGCEFAEAFELIRWID
jgi:LmbE family N-acetylglucosaminyl deacetylase